jgi:hypothetical protein
MTAAGLPLPNSPRLAGWCRQLLARRPSGLWIGTVLVRRIEVLAKVTRTRQVDPLAQCILAALDLEQTSPGHPDSPSPASRSGPAVRLADLESCLGLDSSFLRSLIGSLERDALVVPVNRDDATPARALTLLGATTLAQGELCRTVYERRSFSFLERSTPPRRLRFTSLLGEEWVTPIASPSSPCEVAPFDPCVLDTCLQESPVWKQRHGFPQDVFAIVPLEGGDSGPPLAPEFWRRVPVDRPGQMLVVLSRESEAVHAFAVRPQDGVLQTAGPCFSLGDGDWKNMYPELDSDPPAEAWQRAWVEWGQGRGLPVAELEACPIQRAGLYVRAEVSKRLMGRLRSARSEGWKGDNWLAAGTGPLRACARLEIATN